MNELVRKSLPSKLAAVGFIFMILLGNYWMILTITNQLSPQWLMNSFLFAAIWILICAVGVAYQSVRHRHYVPSEDTEGD